MGQQCTLQMPARDNNARYLGHPVELNNNRLAGRKNNKFQWENERLAMLNAMY